MPKCTSLSVEAESKYGQTHCKGTKREVLKGMCARGIISKKYARCINLVRGAGQLTHEVMEYLLLTWRDALSQGI